MAFVVRKLKRFCKFILILTFQIEFCNNFAENYISFFHFTDGEMKNKKAFLIFIYES